MRVKATAAAAAAGATCLLCLDPVYPEQDSAEVHAYDGAVPQLKGYVHTSCYESWLKHWPAPFERTERTSSSNSPATDVPRG